MARRSGITCVLALLLFVPAPSPAQGNDPWSQEPLPRWVGDFTVLSANAAVGGITAGVIQKVRGGSFQDGFARGALGGAVVYAGKRVVIQRWDGAGLVGRQVAAVGTSVVRNAAGGRPSLERVVLPLGPIRFHVRLDSGVVVRPKLDLNTLIWSGYAASRPELKWDAARSASSGAMVFRSPGKGMRYTPTGQEILGFAAAGAILLSDIPAWRGDVDGTFAHERVHTLQYDFASGAWGDPLQESLVRLAPGTRLLDRYVDVNLLEPLAHVSNLIIKEHDRRPWEMEANFLRQR
ncbi:MAG: hypothetical protein M3434_08110 [Gemmatimonadota bacterium]|jgi:hypothetical protein|nr:hypothetical protein [Gemmatimonadota bacterium]